MSHEPVVQARPAGWWRSAVVYQIYPRSFADSNGDGIGDLPGHHRSARLPGRARGGRGVAVAGLHARRRTTTATTSATTRTSTRSSAPWPTSTRSSPALHERGMKLVMDLVVNHTSDEHAWFVESRDPASPKRDWYWWRPAREGSSPAPRGRADQLGGGLLRVRRGSSTSGPASTSCTCSAPSSLI